MEKTKTSSYRSEYLDWVRGLSFLPGLCLPPATVGPQRVPGAVAGGVQGGRAELHGTVDRRVQRDGPVRDGGTHPRVRGAWPGDRGAVAGDFRDGLVGGAVDRPQLHRSRLQFLRYLSLGCLSGLRGERRFGD